VDRFPVVLTASATLSGLLGSVVSPPGQPGNRSLTNRSDRGGDHLRTWPRSRLVTQTAPRPAVPHHKSSHRVDVADGDIYIVGRRLGFVTEDCYAIWVSEA